MSVRHSLGYFRSLAVSLTVAFAMFAGTTLIHAQEMDLNEFESLIGTGQTLSAISSEQALDILIMAQGHVAMGELHLDF